MGLLTSLFVSKERAIAKALYTYYCSPQFQEEFEQRLRVITNKFEAQPRFKEQCVIFRCVLIDYILQTQLKATRILDSFTELRKEYVVTNNNAVLYYHRAAQLAQYTDSATNIGFLFTNNILKEKDTKVAIFITAEFLTMSKEIKELINFNIRQKEAVCR